MGTRACVPGMPMRRSANVVAAPFSPLSLPNLALWLTPEYGLYQERTGASATTPAVADGDPVGTWVGRAAGGALVYLTAPSDAARPTLKLAIQNGRAIVRFDGTDDTLFIATGFTSLASKTARSAYLVSAARTTASNKITVADAEGATTNAVTIQVGATDNYYSAVGGVPYGGVAYTTTDFTLISDIFDGSLSGNANRLKVYVDSVQQSLTFAGTIPAATGAACDALYLCRRTTSASLFANADIGDLILTTDADQRATVESYLNARWGVY